MNLDKKWRVSDLAKAVGVHPNTIRRWADNGFIEYKLDWRGWRYFPNGEAEIIRLRKLLGMNGS